MKVVWLEPSNHQMSGTDMERVIEAKCRHERKDDNVIVQRCDIPLTHHDIRKYRSASCSDGAGYSSEREDEPPCSEREDEHF